MSDLDDKLIFEAYLLCEMKIVGTIPEGEYYIVGHRDKIWVYSDPDFDQDDEKFRGMIDELDQSDYDNHYSMLFPHDYTNITDLGDIEDRYPDFIFGEVEDGILTLYNSELTNYYNPQTSLLLNKIAKSLKIYQIRTSEESSYIQEYSRLPTWGYHGTSSKYLKDILRLGLRAGRNNGNWGEIQHSDKIFFTQVENLAIFHSIHSTLNEGYPVIIQFKIPDQSKIIPDFDKDVESTKSNEKTSIYSDIRTRVNSDSHKKYTPKSKFSPMRRSNEGGMWGYNGNIMPKFIDSIYLYGENVEGGELALNEYTEFEDLNYVKQVLELTEEFGEDFIYYLGMDIEDIQSQLNGEDEEDYE